MTTANRAKTGKESPVNPETFAPYFEKLTERHTEISKALKDSHQRSQRIGTEFINALLASQQDLLELTQKVATKPQDFAANVKAMVDATSAAQERTLGLAKVFYREQTDAGSEMRKLFQAVCDSSNTMSEAGRNIVNFWIKPR
jgi:hypothetical protein